MGYTCGVIIDLERFVRQERPYWDELSRLVDTFEGARKRGVSLEQARRLHYLYERASADLARLDTFASNQELRAYVESVVARAYAQVHDTRQRTRLHPLRWLTVTFPCTFRSHIGSFWMSLAVTIAGVLLGVFLMTVDPGAQSVMLAGFPDLQQDVAKHVQEREAESAQGLQGRNLMFGFYINNNTSAAIKCMVFGVTLGLGTVWVLFTNGVILGAVFYKFTAAGYAAYVFGWLLPHGVPEISAIILAGQAGFVLARAMIGWGDHNSLSRRMRAVAGPLTTLIIGVALLLIWAAALEAWLSQYHEPVLKYWMKILFGCLEFVMLYAFLAFSGRGQKVQEELA